MELSLLSMMLLKFFKSSSVEMSSARRMEMRTKRKGGLKPGPSRAGVGSEGLHKCEAGRAQYCQDSYFGHTFQSTMETNWGARI